MRPHKRVNRDCLTGKVPTSKVLFNLIRKNLSLRLFFSGVCLSICGDVDDDALFAYNLAVFHYLVNALEPERCILSAHNLSLRNSLE